MGKAIGIGGVFLHFKGELKDIHNWYEKELGLDMTDYGTGFLSGEQLCLLSFKRGDDEGHMPYLNLRVDGIDSLIDKFKQDGLKIMMDVENYPYGKFARFVDPFGNSIELWEPNEEEYIKMVQKEIEEYKKKKSS